nr:MAG TPA: hypothetical protein [Caudoviricetes sp.]
MQFPINTTFPLRLVIRVVFSLLTHHTTPLYFLV